MKQQRRSSLAGCFVLLLFALYATACAGTNGDTVAYPHGIVPKLDSARICELKRLAAPNESKIYWDSMRICLYGSTYDRDLLDLICYIDTNQNIKTSLSQRNRGDLQEVYGEHFVYAAVLSEIRLDSTGADSISVARTVLGYEREPSDQTISGILRAVSAAVFGQGVGGSSSSEPFADKVVDLRLHKYSDKGKTLYFGAAKFSLAHNSKNRIVVTPRIDTLTFRSINYSFGNFDKSFFGASLGMGYTQADGLSEPEKLRLYVFLYLYLMRPTLPVEKEFRHAPSSIWTCVSLAAGTNFASGTIFNNLALGLRINLLDNVGVFVGGNYVLRRDSVRTMGAMVGLDYRL
jgi:hypothetical protein